MDHIFKFMSSQNTNSSQIQIPQIMALKTACVTQLSNPNNNNILLDHDDTNNNDVNPAATFINHNNNNLDQLSNDDDDNVKRSDVFRDKLAKNEFMVIGHRGTGMNLLQSPDPRMKSIKENSILAFNSAAQLNLHFLEFDVQVTKDGCPVIFHDSFIYTQDKGEIIEKRVTDLNLDEFLSYGPQRDPNRVGKPLFRKTKDGRIFEWKVEKDDYLCTLEEVFQNINHSKGFNIEFKFDDNIVYKEEELVHAIEIVLCVVSKYAKDRSIFFSSFQPDATLLVRKLQSTYPVFFLTNGGSETYTDVRRNSLDEAIKLCLTGSLNGIVAEVRSVLRNPGVIRRIKDYNLSLISYGQLNNVREVVHAQILMGVDGVIVDLVQEITEAVAEFSKKAEKDGVVREGESDDIKCSHYELSNLMKLIPNLVQL
uniref:glycerophosphodiester phosphodiesterase GDPD1, chloroplastic-like n=1 Tax=Erigeron canadensis TaxID=72917 RepID=UPI001CB99EB2|nr:glycerophosphodiester phosphodiesterase GDPD1, chloroplastic-like [Erigeron canadensis]